jgi:hypothetical protein
MLGAHTTAPIANDKRHSVASNRRVLAIKLDRMKKQITLGTVIDPAISTVGTEMARTRPMIRGFIVTRPSGYVPPATNRDPQGVC